MGQKILLAETFTDATLPAIYDDTIMSAGLLILNDQQPWRRLASRSITACWKANIAAGGEWPIAGAPGPVRAVLFWSSKRGGPTRLSFPLIERTPKKACT